MQRKNPIVVVIILILMCGVVIVAMNYDNQDEMAAAGGEYTSDISYTSEELQDMYRKYNITENDMKFARNELPNYLDGTILHGDLRVLVTETGEPLERMKEGEHYDVVISEKEMITIHEEAIRNYIEKYGVDPSNPKLDEVNGYLIPNEEITKFIITHPIKRILGNTD